MAGAKIGFGSGATELTGTADGYAKVALANTDAPGSVGAVRITVLMHGVTLVWTRALASGRRAAGPRPAQPRRRRKPSHTPGGRRATWDR